MNNFILTVLAITALLSAQSCNKEYYESTTCGCSSPRTMKIQLESAEGIKLFDVEDFDSSLTRYYELKDGILKPYTWPVTGTAAKLFFAPEENNLYWTQSFFLSGSSFNATQYVSFFENDIDTFTLSVRQRDNKTYVETIFNGEKTSYIPYNGEKLIITKM